MRPGVAHQHPIEVERFIAQIGLHGDVAQTIDDSTDLAGVLKFIDLAPVFVATGSYLDGWDNMFGGGNI